MPFGKIFWRFSTDFDNIARTVAESEISRFGAHEFQRLRRRIAEREKVRQVHAVARSAVHLAAHDAVSLRIPGLLYRSDPLSAGWGGDGGDPVGELWGQLPQSSALVRRGGGALG